MSKKIKVLTLSDHPLSPSGVGTQTKYMCTALLDSGKFQISSFGGAIKHHNYQPQIIEPYGEEWKIFPIDGYGNPEMLRSIIRNEKPDIVWIMTDPRFWGWLWGMENEIRGLCPLVYYHVWDNYPYPMFNKKYYESNDHIVTISRLTDDIVRNVAPEVTCTYLPHAVDNEIFIPHSPEIVKKLRESNLEEVDRDKFIVFWNSRNARRKQSGSLIWWWKEWLDERDLHEKAQLIMHTDPKDVHGQDLDEIVNHLGLNKRQVLFSRSKLDPAGLAAMYNMADATISVSDAEGFGLSTLESLSCGTPIIATVTGGLQDQIMSGGETFGIPLFPVSKSIIGSQDVPYIYEDRLSGDHVKSALSNLYDLKPEQRQEMGLKGREHVMENFNLKQFNQRWVDLMVDIHEKNGSWDTRQGYSSITFEEIV